MTEYYLQGSNGYILVYDLTSLSSIKNLENWHKRIQENCGDIPFIVVGNKCDLIDQIEVDDNKLKPFLKKYKTNFYKTSARTGENLNKPFLELTKKILESCIEEK
jgi:small GTP-binding protein